tara:strand:- start:5403 stop:5510 length:108 start_codon:yes stop_codon:yes gene_type:complete
MKKREIFGAWLGMGLLAALFIYPAYLKAKQNKIKK